VYLPLRPSLQDRHRAIGVLKKGYVSGRLSTETFEERVAVAHTTRSRAELRALLADVSAAWMAASTLMPKRRTHRVEITPQATLLLSRCDRKRLTVGRGRRCDLVFGSGAVSRRHAVFERTPAGWLVSDLASMNGTFVDGVRVERAPVAAGCTVCLGDSYLVIV
jgi:pSer/pThr/pTyr-binding forkhead associated (FHA) protein